MSCVFGIGRQVRLPVFHGDQERAELVDGYEVLSQPYVNGMNKVEIQPLRYVGPAEQGLWRGLQPVGQADTIRPGHLTRLILAQSHS